MLKRVGLVAAIAAALSVAASTTAWGSAKAPARALASAAASAAVKCGKTRTIGMAAPVTGPASDIGNQQIRWAKYYINRWNKKHASKRIKLVLGDTQLGVDTAFAVKVAQSFKSNSKLLGVVGPAGSQEVVASTNTERRSNPAADSTFQGVPRATKTPVPGSSARVSPPTVAVALPSRT